MWWQDTLIGWTHAKAAPTINFIIGSDGGIGEPISNCSRVYYIHLSVALGKGIYSSPAPPPAMG